MKIIKDLFVTIGMLVGACIIIAVSCAVVLGITELINRIT